MRGGESVDMQKEKALKEDLIEQIQLLSNWNRKNINFDPEQVRKNIETILTHVPVID